MVQLDLNLKHVNESHACCNSYFFKSCVFVHIHLHEKFACTARTLIAVIMMSNSKLHDTSILGQLMEMRMFIMHT